MKNNFEITVGMMLYNGGMPVPGKVTDITDEGFFVGEYFFEWDNLAFYKGFQPILLK